MTDLNDGESLQVPGASGIAYRLGNTGGVYSCTCPAWQTQLIPVERRTCKHLRRLRGDAAEDARIGKYATAARPKPPAATNPTSPMPADPPAATRLPQPTECEAVVLEYYLDQDRPTGFRCRLGDGRAVVASVGSGDRLRDCPPPVGGIATLRYQQVSETGVPVGACLVRSAVAK